MLRRLSPRSKLARKSTNFVDVARIFGHDPARFHLTLMDENGEVSRRDVSEAEFEKIMSSSAGEAQVARMSDQEAHDAFRLIRWTDPAAKGHSALQLSRHLDCQYKTAFVLAHKISEVLADTKEAEETVSGEVEIDGAYFVGPCAASQLEREPPRPAACGQSKWRAPGCRYYARARGITLPFVFRSGPQSIATIASRVEGNALGSPRL
jgi:hypothetical protein